MGDVGLKEAVAMALGGMIGGGIYSAFGIVVAISGNVAWVAFLLAGVVAMCAGYSYVKLNKHMDGTGGAPSFIREMGLLPEWLSGSGDSEIPKKLVVVLGALSAAFGVYGSLSSITSFVSLVFIAVFGGMSYLAFKQRHEFDDLVAVVPAVGAVGSAVFFPLLLYNLYLNSPSVFSLVILIAVVVVGVELLYFEREPVEELLP
jgi:putative cofactor-binding repeat protein